MEAAFGSSTGDPAFNPRADLNTDGTINSSDLGPFREAFQATCTPP